MGRRCARDLLEGTRPNYGQQAHREMLGEEWKELTTDGVSHQSYLMGSGSNET